MAAARELLQRAEPRERRVRPSTGSELTCELVKQHVERAFAEHGCTADDFIVSHGSQTAVGHDMGARRDRRRTTSSCSTSSRATASRRASPT